jgi:hypothetical protein
MAYSSDNFDPFELIFRNLHSLLPLLAVLAAWVVATWKKLSKPGGGKAAPAAAAADETERTRRVQEEVRRKIAERRAGFPPPSAAPPRVAPRVVPPMEDVPADELAEGRERQRKLLEQIRALDAGRTAAPVAPVSGPSATAASPASDWLAELREPANARRAIVWREILGPPVGLR